MSNDTPPKCPECGSTDLCIKCLACSNCSHIGFYHGLCSICGGPVTGDEGEM